jgi:hypothetical protein
MKPDTNVSQIGITVAVIAIVIALKGLSLYNVANTQTSATIDSEANIRVDESCQYACCKNGGDRPSFDYRCPDQQHR